jgi:hypothetical protein
LNRCSSVAGHLATVFNFGWQVREKKQISTHADMSFTHTHKQNNLPLQFRQFHFLLFQCQLLREHRFFWGRNSIGKNLEPVAEDLG